MCQNDIRKITFILCYVVLPPKTCLKGKPRVFAKPKAGVVSCPFKTLTPFPFTPFAPRTPCLPPLGVAASMPRVGESGFSEGKGRHLENPPSHATCPPAKTLSFREFLAGLRTSVIGFLQMSLPFQKRVSAKYLTIRNVGHIFVPSLQ